MTDDLLRFIADQSDTVIDLQQSLTSIVALGPTNGGDGERAKADFLIDYLKKLGVADVSEIAAPDDRVPCGVRPSVVARIPGVDTSRTLWVISHVDVVPAGDRMLWATDPFELAVDGDVIVGRGVEDNQQGIVSSLLVAKGLIKLNIVPPINYGVLLVADEETGSKFGLDYIARQHPEVFGPDDLIVVPDFGSADGSMVEVAEKSMLWLKFTLTGKQCHASRPEQGINTLTASAELILGLRALHDRFGARSDLFEPPTSTFEATMKEANVPNVNTIPGRDVFYLDCRVLPQYSLEDVEAAVREIADNVAANTGASIDFEPVQREQAAPETPLDSAIVQRILPAIRDEYGVEPKPAGIGGGTVAAFLRRRGHKAVVWASLLNNAHQPGETGRISANIGDAKVLARVLMAD